MGFYRSRSSLAAACGLLTLSGLVSAGAPVCRAEAGSQPMSKGIDLDVAAGDLHAVVSMLERQANVEALVCDGDKPFKQVYVHLDNASLPKALRTIAQSAGAKVHKNDDGVYVFEPETISDGESRPSALNDSSPSGTSAPSVAPAAHIPAGSLHWQTMVLVHAVPSKILHTLQWDQDVVQEDPFKPLQLLTNRPNITSTQTNIPKHVSEFSECRLLQ